MYMYLEYELEWTLYAQQTLVEAVYVWGEKGKIVWE